MDTHDTSQGPLRLKRAWLPFSWKSLDAYIFSEIHTPFFMSMLVYNGIFFIRMLSGVTELTGGKFEIPFEIVLLYFAAILPETLFLTTALSFFFASLAALGRMSGDSEIIAPQSAGISFWRMSKPVITYGFILSIILFALMNHVGPKLKQTWQFRYRNFIDYAALPNIQPGVITPMGKNSVLYVDRVAEGKLADLISINQSSKDNQEEIMLARRASLYTNRELELFDTYTLQLTPDNEADETAVSMMSSANLVQQITIPEDFRGGASGLRPKDLLSTQQIYKLLQTEKQDDPILLSELYRRLFSPFICFIFAFFAVPLAAKHSRLRRGSGFGLSLVIVGVYMTLEKLGRDAAVQGKMDPFVASAALPFAFLAFGLFLQIGKNQGWNRRFEKMRDRISYYISRCVSALLGVFRLFRRKKLKTERRDSEDNPRLTTWNFPAKLDIYVTRSFLSIYLLVQSSLVMLILLVEYTQISKSVHKNGVGLDVVLRYLAYKIPEVLNLSMFLCLLISVLILFAIMSKNHEVTVIRAGGGSLQRLCIPLLFCGVLASGFTWYMENEFLPQSNRLAISANNKIKNRKDALFSNDVWIKRPSGEILNYRFYDERTRTLHGVRMYQFDLEENKTVERVELPSLAYTGVWVAAETGLAQTFSLNESYNPRPVEAGESFDLKLDLEDLNQKRRKASEFSIAELRDYVTYLKNLGYDETHYQTELYAKYAKPLIPLIMMLLAMPLGFQFGRRGTFYGVGAGLVSGLVFFGLFELLKLMGSSGFVAPLAAGWGVVTLFGFTALYRFINLE